MMRRLKLTYSMVLLCCLFCGTAAGTILANSLGGSQQELFESFGLAAFGCGGLTAAQRRSLWASAVRQRLSEFGLAALVGMTPLAAGGFAVMTFAAGAACGLTISALTFERGLSGLPFFVLSVFPQCFFYLPVWAFMASRAGEGLERLRLRVWLFLTGLALAGTFLEAYVNPLLLRS